jgi:hypothetical protein
MHGQSSQKNLLLHLNRGQTWFVFAFLRLKKILIRSGKTLRCQPRIRIRGRFVEAGLLELLPRFISWWLSYFDTDYGSFKKNSLFRAVKIAFLKFPGFLILNSSPNNQNPEASPITWPETTLGSWFQQLGGICDRFGAVLRNLRKQPSK